MTKQALGNFALIAENLVFQNPVDMEFVVTVGDFTRAAKSRIRATPKSQHGTFFFCFLCMTNIKAAKEKKMTKKAVPRAPCKTSLIVKFPIKILAELRQLAAFHCQALLFSSNVKKQTGRVCMH